MIRYVLAVVLAIALLVLAVPAIDRVATMNAEREVDASVAAIDGAATSLATNEEVSPAGHPDPQRVVEVTLPRRSLTTTGVDHFEVVPHEDVAFSDARYVLEDGTTREAIVDERIVWNDSEAFEPLEIDGSGTVRLVLTLEADANGDPIVVAGLA